MLKENKKVLIACSLALLACLIWGYNYILARQINQSINPIDISFWRWVIAVIVLFPFAKPHFKEGIPKIKESPRSYFYMGFLSVCIYNILFFSAARYTTANNIALLGTTSFIWTIIIVGIRGIEKVTRNKIIACLLSFSGALMVIGKGHIANLKLSSLNIGDLMMLGASLTWGIYASMVKKRPHQLNQCFFLFAIAIFGLLTLTPIYLINICINGFAEFTYHTIAVYLFVGVFVSAIAWSCYNYCIEVLGPIRTSIFFYLLPPIVAVFSSFILDEKIQRYHIIGFIFVVSGIIISNLNRKNKDAPEIAEL